MAMKNECLFTQCTLFSGAPLPGPGRQEAATDTLRLPAICCCSSTGRRLRSPATRALRSLPPALLRVRNWRWRRRTDPGSSPWVREVEISQGALERSVCLNEARSQSSNVSVCNEIMTQENNFQKLLG